MPSSTAHPRAGGENQFGHNNGARCSGSSPRGRGKRPVLAQLNRVVRLIPARAGKTVRRTRCRTSSPAHPRAGGENAKSWRAGMATSGSSPRGRGKPEVWSKGSLRWRLIPARAGKTRGRKPAGRGGRAHPRAGGENRSGKVTRKPVAGSSPRRRGKRGSGLDNLHGVRLIPA